MTRPSTTALVSLPNLPTIRASAEIYPPDRAAGITWAQVESLAWEGAEGPLTPEQEAVCAALAEEIEEALLEERSERAAAARAAQEEQAEAAYLRLAGD